ncbi:MAG: glycoside hydrolase family 15 protein, partial [Thermoplasmata archaeon]|nr:glycoside hydrolase family 15 protein [Thermoplasmata archaeon]
MERWGTGDAFGAPGIDPRWQHGDKSGIGTAYSNDSRVWFTLWRGILTECYFPLIDRPQTRDLQFLITDSEGLFHEERRHLEPTVERLDAHSLGYRIRNVDPGGRYSLTKEIIAAPHLPAVLQHVELTAEPGTPPLRLHVLLAPHLDGGGQHNNGYVLRQQDRTILAAERNGYALAMAATAPFSQASAGFVGASDLWTDITAHRQMTWQFDRAQDGNVALAGELDLPPTNTFTLALAFGQGIPSAVSTLLQTLAHPFAQHRTRFIAQWARKSQTLRPLHGASQDQGLLYRSSASVLLAHEDKTFPGAFIASLAIPWGNAENDSDRGGYHLVWTRDLYQIATGLLASGHTESALRSLIYLAATQQPDGSFPQNSWLDGTAYWTGLQLDEVAFPILLAG